jgi:hypothetical protein
MERRWASARIAASELRARDFGGKRDATGERLQDVKSLERRGSRLDCQLAS